MGRVRRDDVSHLTSDSFGQLHVADHDGNASGMDGTEVGVFEEASHVCLGSFLQSHQSACLKAEACVLDTRDLLHKSLERPLFDE